MDRYKKPGGDRGRDSTQARKSLRRGEQSSMLPPGVYKCHHPRRPFFASYVDAQGKTRYAGTFATAAAAAAAVAGLAQRRQVYSAAT